MGLRRVASWGICLPFMLQSAPSSPQPAPAGAPILFSLNFEFCPAPRFPFQTTPASASPGRTKKRDLIFTQPTHRLTSDNLRLSKFLYYVQCTLWISHVSLSIYIQICLWKPSIPRMLYIVKWHHNTPFMNLIFNWKMGSSIQFNSSTILCERQNLIVDSILRFIQYSFYVHAEQNLQSNRYII